MDREVRMGSDENLRASYVGGIQQSTFNGSQPTFSGSKPTFSGSHTILSGAQPTFSGAQPTLSGSQPTFSGAQPTFSDQLSMVYNFSGSQPQCFYCLITRPRPSGTVADIIYNI